MENLTPDIFFLILAYLPIDETSALPVCSHSCRDLWLEHAQIEVHRRSREFIHPFMFEEGSSVTSKYYAIVEALRFFSEARRSLQQKCHEPLNNSDTAQALELVRETRSLMSRNYPRDCETHVMNVCTRALWRATGSYDLRPMELDDYSLDIEVVDTARPLLELLFSRLMELISAGCSESDLLHCVEPATPSTYLVQMKSIPPDEEGGERTLRQSLEVYPAGILARGLLVRHLVNSGRADESVAVLLAGFPFAEVPAHVCVLLRPVNHNIHLYGIARMHTVFREALRSLQRPEMPNPEQRDTLKASLESIVGLV